MSRSIFRLSDYDGVYSCDPVTMAFNAMWQLHGELGIRGMDGLGHVITSFGFITTFVAAAPSPLQNFKIESAAFFLLRDYL